VGADRHRGEVGAAPQDALSWAADAPPTTMTYCAA
jgi:hypothetical protein